MRVCVLVYKCVHMCGNVDVGVKPQACFEKFYCNTELSIFSLSS